MGSRHAGALPQRPAGLSTGHNGPPDSHPRHRSGLRRTGWGLIEVEGNRLIYVACGSVATSDRSRSRERLVAIHDGLVSA